MSHRRSDSNPGAILASLAFTLLIGGSCLGIGCSNTPVETPHQDSVQKSASHKENRATVEDSAQLDNKALHFPSDPAQTPIHGLAPRDLAAEQLLHEMIIEKNQNRRAAEIALSAATRMMNDLDYAGATRSARKALQLNSDNGEARRLLDDLLFLQGDRGGSFRAFSREIAARRDVSDQQRVAELRRTLRTAFTQWEEEAYDDAAKSFERALDKLELLEKPNFGAPSAHLNQMRLEIEEMQKLYTAQKAAKPSSS